MPLGVSDDEPSQSETLIMAVLARGIPVVSFVGYIPYAIWWELPRYEQGHLVFQYR